MKPLRSSTMVLLLLMFGVQMAQSHHSFSGVYDGKRLVTVTGVVTQFKFVNPHALLLMDVTDEAGKVSKWTIEFAGRLNLSEIGWAAAGCQASRARTGTGRPTTTARAP